MIGNFNRDRSPFVLTPDMAFVIDGCEKKPSEKFHEFVDLCCKGIYFNLFETCNGIIHFGNSKVYLNQSFI